jgi:putative ABC transport system permease protein
MSALLQDIRYGIRTLARSPAFTIVAVLTLALGIGANVAIFSVVNAVLLRSLPYDHPERILAVFETNDRGGRMNLSREDFQDWRDQSKSFQNLAAYAVGQFNFGGGNEPARVNGIAATPGFFDVFGVRPIMGRTFGAQERAAGEWSVAVISEGLWKSQFGGQASALGRTVYADGAPYTIVGVLPGEFDFPTANQFWIPLDLSKDDSDRSAHNYRIVGKLKDGVALLQAQAEISGIAERLADEYPSSNKNVGATLFRLQDAMTLRVRESLVLLLVSVALVLLIACANLANLLLVRASTRRREIAVRATLGASRWRLVRQLLVESLLVAFAGGAAGLCVSLWIGKFLTALVPANLLPVRSTPVDFSVLGFAIGLIFVTVILFGLAPAFHAARVDLTQALRKTTGGGGGGTPFRSALVVVEIALSVLLLTGAGLMMRSLLALENERLGFDSNDLLVASVSFPPAYTDMTASSPWWARPAGKTADTFAILIQRLKNLPGVQSVAATDAVPLSNGGSDGSFSIAGRSDQDGGNRGYADWRLASEGYFLTMKIPLLQGRQFQAGDRSGEKVVIVNETLAKKYWSGGDPIGKRIAIPGLDGQTYSAFKKNSNIWFDIVGVVGEVRNDAAGRPPEPTLYIPYFQTDRAAEGMDVVLRTSLPLASLRTFINQEVQGTRPDAPVELASYNSVYLTSIALPRFRSYLIGAFAFLALALAAVGIYGVVCYVTEQRTSEIGIRMALGARPHDVLTLVIKQFAGVTALGLAAGLAAALVLTRFVSSFLYGIQASDAATFIGVSLVISAATLAACYVPARRAMGVDPMVVLRHE